jgi:uncharacterized membrane protein
VVYPLSFYLKGGRKMANRICLTCGNAYEYCGSCPTSLNLPVWKNIFDTENCKIVFETVSDYAQNVITKDVAKEKLSKYNTSGKCKENIRKYLKDIMAESKAEIVVETETETEIEKEEQSIPKTKYNKKKVVTEISD